VGIKLYWTPNRRQLPYFILSDVTATEAEA